MKIIGGRVSSRSHGAGRVMISVSPYITINYIPVFSSHTAKIIMMHWGYLCAFLIS